MLDFLPGPLKGCLAILLVLFNTLLGYPALLFFALLKLIVPANSVRKRCTRALNAIANFWIANNGRFMRLLNRIDWKIELPDDLKREDWYLVTCNHQSWADIPAIQFALEGKIPLLKFFLKRELIWVPFLGIAWWALDFPFMKRYSKALLARRPELRGKDLETTRKACQHFQYTPVTVFNFVEGTRFTPEKHLQQQSPYQHLLKPKAGGIAFVLGAMGEQLHTMLDVTILYPKGANGIWQLLCGQVKRIVIHVKRLQIPDQFRNRDYSNDEQFRLAFQLWLSELWQQKDQRLEVLSHEYGIQ